MSGRSGDDLPRTIEILVAGGAMPAAVWTPPGGTGPGVVVLHEIFGVTGYIRARCADLAGLGYVVCAPQLYWRQGAPVIEESAPDALADAMALAGRLDWPTAVADAAAALEHVRGMIEVIGKVAVLGFCFGGGLAFAVAAEARPDALVSYYGSALPSLLDRAAEVTCPSLHHFGLADTFIPPETVRRIEEAVTVSPHVRFETYPGAGHAFDNPHPPFHHPEASRAAWGNTVRFLADRLASTGIPPSRP